MTLKPFWRYYGGKWRAAPSYPAPLHNTIVEPFAGLLDTAFDMPKDGSFSWRLIRL